MPLLGGKTGFFFTKNKERKGTKKKTKSNKKTIKNNK